MTPSPYAAPRARIADRPQAVVPRPRRVALAVALLWISFALAVPIWYAASARTPEVSFHPVALAFTVLVFCFCAFVNVRVYGGRNWARIVCLVLVAISGLALFLPSEDTLAPGAFEQAGNYFTQAIEMLAMYLLFTGPGAAWFRRADQ